MSDSGRLITPALVDLYLAPDDKSEALRALAQRLVAEGRVTDLDGFLADIAAREAQAPPGSATASASRTAGPPTSPGRAWPSGAARAAWTSTRRTGSPPTWSS